MTSPSDVPAGTKLNISLIDMVAPWVGSTIWVNFVDGTKVQAKILSATNEGAEVITLAKKSRSSLDPPHLQD